jgi:formyltetrahydrofolate hydrolase
LRSRILLIDSPDRPGLVAAIAQFLYAHGGKILHVDQYQDNEMGKFFMRIEWSLDGFDLDEAAFRQRFARLADEFTMAWTLAWAGSRLRIALFVSRYQHCLIDLLHRHQIGELEGDIALVVSNHQNAKSFADFYSVPSIISRLRPQTNWKWKHRKSNYWKIVKSISSCWRGTCRFYLHHSWLDFRDESSTSTTPFFQLLALPSPIMRRSSAV